MASTAIKILDSQPAPVVQVCSFCSIPCSQSCGNCLKANYCSQKCQKLDWKNGHKSLCYPAEIKEDPVKGRYLRATRDIPKGQIIFKEKPLMIGPSGKFRTHPVCLGCFRKVDANIKEKYKCENCKWPFCSSDCDLNQNNLHSEYECKILAENEISPFKAHQTDLYENITILRCLLLKRNCPDLFAKILDLQSHADLRKARESKQGFVRTQSTPKYFIGKLCNLSKEFDETEIYHVSGVLRTNAFCSDDTINYPLFRSGTYLFYLASMTEHSCTPNAMWVIQLNSELHLRASVDIKKSDPITQSYSSPIYGTEFRRNDLKSHFFECCCLRCLDKTEFGSYFSAVKCSLCHSHFLPIKPLIEDSEWACLNEKTCQAQRKKVGEIRELFDAINKDHELVSSEDNLENIQKLESLLEANEEITLHQNNYFIHSIEHDIIQRISYILALNEADFLSNNENEFLIKRMVNLSRKCLTVCDLIWPGYSRYRGRLLYFLQQGLIILLSRKVQSSNKNKKDLIIFKKELDEILKIRKEVQFIFSIEPKGLTEEYLLGKSMVEDNSNIVGIKKALKLI